MPRFDALELKVVSREQQRDRMRQEFPAATAIVDEFREVFGDVQVLRIEEGGKVVQSKRYRPDSDFGILTADQYLAIGRRYREEMSRRREIEERKRHGK